MIFLYAPRAFRDLIPGPGYCPFGKRAYPAPALPPSTAAKDSEFRLVFFSENCFSFSLAFFSFQREKGYLTGQLRTEQLTAIIKYLQLISGWNETFIPIKLFNNNACCQFFLLLVDQSVALPFSMPPARLSFGSFRRESAITGLVWPFTPRPRSPQRLVPAREASLHPPFEGLHSVQA